MFEENLYSNIYLCLVAGGYLDLTAVEVTGGNSNGRLDPGESANLVISVQNSGVLIEMTGVTATLGCDDPYVQLSDAYSELGDIAPSATVTSAADPFALSVAAACPEGRQVNFTIRLAGGNDVVVNETLTLTTTVGTGGDIILGTIGDELAIRFLDVNANGTAVLNA
ncbi:MAG: hypothetical protein HQ594_07300, partial [Candidatus Omnitrophica bacterium]|nr:hypothetical protein [Candidatus Omnitrophota bacterium]